MEPEIGLAPLTGLSFRLTDAVGVLASFGGYCAFNRSSPRNGLHRHTYHEICLVLQGRGEYRHGKDLLPIRQGDVFLAEPDVFHEIRLSAEESDGQMQLLYFLVLSVPGQQEIPQDSSPLTGTTADWVRWSVNAFYRSHVILAAGRFELLSYGTFLSMMDGEGDSVAHGIPRPGRPAVLRILETLLIECLAALTPESSIESQSDATVIGQAGGIRLRTLVEKTASETGTFTWMDKKPPSRAELVLTTERTADSSDPLSDAMRLIRRNPAAEMSLTSLAQLVRTSNRTLQRLFRERQGTTFRAFQLDCRMRQAAALLRMNFSVSDVAVKSGVPDPARFSRVFKKYHGMSPKQYQLSHANQARLFLSRT